MYCNAIGFALHSFPTRRSSDLAGALGAGRPTNRFSRGGETLVPEKCHADEAAGFDPRFICVTLFRNKRSEEHTSELQSRFDIVCRLLLENQNLKEQIDIIKPKV